MAEGKTLKNPKQKVSNNSTVASLEPLFAPRSVAVIGASRKRGTIGGELFHNIVSGGFTGVVYPINPKADSVQAVRAYKTVLEVPDTIDLAVVAVPARVVPAVVDECITKGVKALVVVSAGFKEIGAAGAKVEAELTAKLRKAGVRMVGPNCLGVLNLSDDVRMNATFSPVVCERGSIAFMSQSGALGVAILDYSRDLGLGLSSFVSVGNRADVSANDLLEYWEHDPSTSTVLMYIESFGNPRKFTRIARRLARKKPIVAVKSGRTTSGRRAASSHTGALAGVDIAVDALFRQAGVIRTDTTEELFNTAMVLVNQPLPAGRKIAIITNAGGPGILAADACEHSGLEVTTLSQATMSALQEFLPKEASTRNPVDMIASASAESFRRATEILLKAPEVDILLAIFVPPLVTSPDDVAEAIAEAREGSRKPVVACLIGAHGVKAGRRSLRENRIPSFAFPEAAAKAMAQIATYAEWRRAPEGKEVHFEDTKMASARKLVAEFVGANDSAGGQWLPAHTCSAILNAYGIRMARGEFAPDADAAADAARRIGFPVAIKLASPTLTHKSDVGGIRLNLTSESAVRDATFAIEGHLRAAELEHHMAGVYVQEMISDGVEVIVGASTDKAFGPLMMFGLGGTYVELLKDVSFGLHPLTETDAASMVSGIKGYMLLEGYRNAPPADVDAITEILLRVSQLLGDFPEIVEMDINPLKVLKPGEGAIAVDVRIRIA